MADYLERRLARWVGSAVIGADTTGRIRAFRGLALGRSGTALACLLALAPGSLLLGAGVLLFVSAHWDEVPGSGRMTFVLLMVAVFHAGSLSRDRFRSLSVVPTP